MPESKAHHRAKQAAAGKSGRTEQALSRDRRLDARTVKTATEVERSGNAQSLRAAADRLKASHAEKKVLQVPQKDMDKATQAMRAAKVPGTVKNMGGTRSRGVSRRSR